MMNYIEVRLLTQPQNIPYFEHVLQHHKIQGWIEEDCGDKKGLVFFLPLVDPAQQIINYIHNEIEKCGSTEISLRKIRDEDWEQSWKAYFKPLKIGRFLIKPTWEPLPATSDSSVIVIELDPGMAFGTGDHATTSLCIEFLDEYLKKGDRVLDLGTGSGILSLASLYLGAESIVAVDHDEIALTVAEENLQRLGLLHKATLREQDVLMVNEGSFDIVVGNIFLGEVKKIIETECKPLKEGGFFIGSGITSDQRKKVEEALSQSPFVICAWRTRDIWDAFVVKKVSGKGSAK
ncbi:MAG: 50S ribosomal protein L11 methyltransferase [Geobacter sp.]|nr:MAG: 50S ribosomal protein L11 methyltransferase [Geobacter sp.]